MISVSEQQDRHNERRRACNREDATNAKDTKKFTIGVDGSVTDARVLRSIPLLDFGRPRMRPPVAIRAGAVERQAGADRDDRDGLVSVTRMQSQRHEVTKKTP